MFPQHKRVKAVEKLHRVMGEKVRPAVLMAPEAPEVIRQEVLEVKEARQHPTVK